MQSFASRLSASRGTGVAPVDPQLTVIGAGFGRTGTMSLKIALETLGRGPCYHMTEMVRNPAHPARWTAARAGGPVDWPALFARYRATVDWPGCLFYRELMQAYPDAKVILTVRDSQRWYDSVHNTLYSLKTATDSYLSSWPEGDPDAPAKPQIFYDSRIWDDIFGGRFADREHAIAIFEQHNAEVRATVPADRLLVYQVSQGWQPLCDFLDVPAPDLPFPHLNDQQAFREYNRHLLHPPQPGQPPGR